MFYLWKKQRGIKFLQAVQTLVKKMIKVVSTRGNICICLPIKGVQNEGFLMTPNCPSTDSWLKTNPKRAEHTRWEEFLRGQGAFCKKNVWNDSKWGSERTSAARKREDSTLTCLGTSFLLLIFKGAKDKNKNVILHKDLQVIYS